MATEAQSPTNATPQSRTDIQLNCSNLWSLAQDFAHTRMAEVITYPLGIRIGDTHITAKFLLNYNPRARRIAATYARFYLETEQYGDPEKKGRYYWMALGAFASKTVACTLESFMVLYATPDLGNVMDSLGKGNLWLFNDIAPWHWAYSVDPESFETCKSARDAQDPNMDPIVKQVMESLPWAGEALPKIGQFKSNNYIEEGFSAIKEVEALPHKNSKRTQKQLESLMAIAQHEQQVVLQPLIYEGWAFATLIWLQRQPGIRSIAPPLELVFASACETADPELKSVAPEGTQLENYASRMKWIGNAAEDFHGLMQRTPEYMETELSAMASWVDIT